MASTARRRVAIDSAMPDGAPPLAAAAGILLAALKITGTTSLRELAEQVNNDTCAVEFTDEQRDLLEANAGPLNHIVTNANGVTPTLAVCSICGEHVYLSATATVGTRCAMTIACDGTPVKAKPARRAKVSGEARP